MTFNFYTQDFNLKAGGTQVIVADGAYLKLLNSTGPIRIRTDSGITMKPLAGQGFRRQGFTRIEVMDLSGAANVGSFAIASEDMVDDRISGEVSVIDGGKARTIANTAFWASASVGAGAWYGTVMLYNNSTTKNLIVESVGVGLLGGVDASMHLGFLGSGPAGWTAGNAPKSKMAGGANSVAGQVWTQQPGAPIVPYMVDLYCKSNTTQIIKLTEPIIVGPGYGLCVDCGALNQNMAANFEFYELPL